MSNKYSDAQLCKMSQKLLRYARSHPDSYFLFIMTVSMKSGKSANYIQRAISQYAGKGV